MTALGLPASVGAQLAAAASYGVDAHEAHTTEEVAELVRAGVAARHRPTLVNARTTPAGT
ncbi:hypothetical protein [Mycobacterium sp. 050134]|uniref:hypothetical protein n=1 Tax=Mycobacterium sp. 050134 TaxID=3096111 RepID=UPI002ED77380